MCQETKILERERRWKGESVMRVGCGETYGREIGERERLVLRKDGSTKRGEREEDR